MRKISIILTALLFISVMNAQDLKVIKLNAPDKARGTAVMKAFSDRHSDREYAAKELSAQDLSDLLWAANGINRTDGKRTAPSALNKQDIDVIQLLGLGCNGHIGFNEPADEFTKVTGEIDLTDSTIEANKRFFEKKEDVPRKAVSMGIGTIMRAKKIVLLVNGENKAEILKEVVNGPVTPKVPGSILQFHPHVTVICDEEAAKYL